MNCKQEKIQKIVIVGGGTSGWMSASYLAKSLNFNVQIVLIESPKISRIGVGEATVPTIKTEFFDTLGIPEEEWMAKCQATYKLGVKFLNWKKPPEQGGDHYYHNFGEIPSISEVPLTHAWIKKRLENNFQVPMAYACISSAKACDLNKSPKFYDGRAVQHYAYHFDALKVADFLKDWSVARGVNHILDNLLTAELDENGNITCLVGEKGKYEGDLFIDCSGFSGFLIEKILKEPVVSFEDSLLTDRAIAINVPENSEVDGIRPYTSATAFKAGWLWEIPLFGRSGNGYVYSSQFISDEEAEKEVRTFFGEKAKDLAVRSVKFQSRRRRNSWVKNCVSIGLSSSFLEPLESTGIYFIYAALYQLVKNFPNKNIDSCYRDKFNQKIQYMVEDVKNFIIMHFKTALREDTPFWKANKYETKVPDSLQIILDRQKAGLPIRESHQPDAQLYSSFAAQFENFWTNSNYQCILCGVDYLPNSSLPLLNHRDDIMEKAERIFNEIALESERYSKTLPSQYDYLKYLYGQVALLQKQGNIEVEEIGLS
jgi:tryptophan halogenase